LNTHARQVLEHEVDFILKNSRVVESSSTDVLKAVGIEPNVEAVLSNFVGAIIARVDTVYRLEEGRSMNSDELLELAGILKRRVTEMRAAFMARRIKT
jgi:hypothetical protein